MEDFSKSRRGTKFFDFDLPKIAEQLERIASHLEKKNQIEEKRLILEQKKFLRENKQPNFLDNLNSEDFKSE